MLVISQRWLTMAICRTSTNAAINVIIRLPKWGSSKKNMMRSKQERRNQRQSAQDERRGQQLRYAEQAHFGVGGLDQHDQTADRQQFQKVEKQAHGDTWDSPIRAQAEREERIYEKCHQH